MRVFYSFHLPERAAEMILRDIAPQFTAVPYHKANLHVTLKFVGEVEESSLPKLYAIGRSIADATPAISFSGERVVVEENGRLKLALAADPALYEAYENLNSALNAGGFSAKQQPFVPHVTFGRLKENAAVPASNQEFSRYQFTVRELGLYQSEPTADKMGRFVLLQEFPLLGN